MWTRYKALWLHHFACFQEAGETHKTIEDCGHRTFGIRAWMVFLSALGFHWPRSKEEFSSQHFLLSFFQKKVLYSKGHRILERNFQWLHVSLWHMDEHIQYYHSWIWNLIHVDTQKWRKYQKESLLLATMPRNFSFNFWFVNIPWEGRISTKIYLSSTQELVEKQLCKSHLWDGWERERDRETKFWKTRQQ